MAAVRRRSRRSARLGAVGRHLRQHRVAAPRRRRARTRGRGLRVGGCGRRAARGGSAGAGAASTCATHAGQPSPLMPSKSPKDPSAGLCSFVNVLNVNRQYGKGRVLMLPSAPKVDRGLPCQCRYALLMVTAVLDPAEDKAGCSFQQRDVARRAAHNRPGLAARRIRVWS